MEPGKRQKYWRAQRFLSTNLTPSHNRHHRYGSTQLTNTAAVCKSLGLCPVGSFSGMGCRNSNQPSCGNNERLWKQSRFYVAKYLPCSSIGLYILRKSAFVRLNFITWRMSWHLIPEPLSVLAKPENKILKNMNYMCGCKESSVVFTVSLALSTVAMETIPTHCLFAESGKGGSSRTSLVPSKSLGGISAPSTRAGGVPSLRLNIQLFKQVFLN